jgi:Serine aminopeptidase, S33
MPTSRRALRMLPSLLAAAAVAAALLPGATAQAAPIGASAFDGAVSALEALAYQPAYVPAGTDSAFDSGTVLNTPPIDDYTGGSIVNSTSPPEQQAYDPTGVAGAPPFPSAFHPVSIRLPDDGAKHSGHNVTLTGWAAFHAGRHPAVLVVHGFNTHGVWSVVRWAAMLYANGWDVAAFDQRDFADDTDTEHPQTFGWKEAQDVVAAGAWLRHQPQVTDVGVVGFSEGAQNTVLALSQDTAHVFSAGITFSAPADQNEQIMSTALPGSCEAGACQFPVTDALVALVVPSPNGTAYTDACSALGDAGTAYGTTAFDVLHHESAMHVQTRISVPLLNVYSQDDQLVNPEMAGFMAAFEKGNPLQRTLLVQNGMHAYFYDRWWQQGAILTYFKTLLGGGDASITTTPTVNQTPGGASFGSQLVAIDAPTPAAVDASLHGFACDPSQPAPGLGTASSSSPSASPSPAASATPAPHGNGRSGSRTIGLPNTAATAERPLLPALGVLTLVAAAAAARRRRRRTG